ncbi:SusC/RagA family TonB-linked outer membrane protein [Polaribacter sp. Hel1_85]|uniref:SusC/RagA family TonB-linked outer membrane protein n=1 Tax=Polaribacter sp. Hel1_85 TaxID=1250005 RepID=UPI00052DEF73|nr:TonB-dependent receptor [Polaribacter sp. Hel1_85]KGL58900.1 TonB-dependent receptor, plug [Polaribacter sp. Hel1_85]
MKLKIITLFLCCFSLVSAWSQSVVSGKVTDESAMPLPGVSIIVKGTTTGVSTDFDGNYKITVKKGQILQFLYLGFKNQEITISSQKTINIVMKEDTDQLDEIVVVGYGRQKKESVLGAISQIKGATLLESGTTNIVNALSAIAPGVSIIQTSGQPGEEAGEIFIRGQSDPLILVDGVEVVGGFNNIDTRDVENISVLKDGSATAVYGIRGANGVIIITTKRGRIGKPKISFSSEVTRKNISSTPDVLNSFDAQTALNSGILNDQNYGAGYTNETDLAHFKSGEFPYLYPDTDWQEVLFKEYTTSLNTTLSLRGGNDFVKYYASAGYLQEGDLVNTDQYHNYDPEYKFQKFTFRGNLDFTLSKTTELKTSVSSRLEVKNKPSNTFANTPEFFAIYNSAPGGVVPVYPAEVLEQYIDPLYPGLVEPRFGLGPNPYRDVVNNGLNVSNKTVFNVDLELTKKLDAITKGLTFTLKYNYNSFYNTTRQTSFDGDTGAETFTLNRDGTWTALQTTDWEKSDYYIEGSEGVNDNSNIEYGRAQINYARSFGKHNVTAVGLFSRSKRVTRTEFPYYNEDWVARATYDYDAHYFFEAAASYNGDESFYHGSRFKLFPSFSLGINLAKEKFIADHIPQINNFKLRYSYGQTGNKAGLKIPNTTPTQYLRWLYQSSYAYDTNVATSRYFFGEEVDNNLRVIKEYEIGNDVLTWSTATKQNIGVDFGVFDNKISGSLDFFSDNRTGLIATPQVPIYFGNNAILPKANVNETKSHGMDVALTYKNKTSGGFTYAVTGIYGFYENRVVSNALDFPGTPEYAKLAGKAIGTTNLLQTDGYFQSIDELVNYPSYVGNPGLGDYRYIDFNANGTIIGDSTEDLVRYDLQKAPKHTYSFRFNFGYQNWSLSALLNGVAGYERTIDARLAYALYQGIAAGVYNQLDTWTPDNTDAAYPALHSDPANTNLTDNNTARIINLDYLKLRSVNLGYNFDMSNSKKINKLRLYLSGNNLFTLTKFEYGDPQGNSPGKYPLSARYTFGLNMDF